MQHVPLTKGKETIVDDADYPRLSLFKWHMGNNGYACRKWIGPGYETYLHRFLIDAPRGREVDHINGNKLDNRKSNLRLCSTSQNHGNMRKSIVNTSGYKGVIWRRRERKWLAQITFHKKVVFLGYFDNPIDAARAYNAAAVKYFGEFAHLNEIPQEESNGMA